MSDTRLRLIANVDDNGGGGDVWQAAFKTYCVQFQSPNVYAKNDYDDVDHCRWR